MIQPPALSGAGEGVKNTLVLGGKRKLQHLTIGVKDLLPQREHTHTSLLQRPIYKYIVSIHFYERTFFTLTFNT